MICKQCKKKGLKSKVFPGVGSRTLGYRFIQVESLRISFPVVEKSGLGRLTMVLDEKLKVSELEIYRIGIDDKRKVVAYKRSKG